MSYIKPISTDPLDNPSHSRLHRIFVADSAAPEDSIQVDASGHTLLVQYEQITINSLGTTTADSIILQNTTAAAAGAQQVSPAIRWRGYGWKTTATAASQSIDFRAYVLPVQGTTSPSGTWILDYSKNGGSYGNLLTCDTTGLFNIVAQSGFNATLQIGTNTTIANVSAVLNYSAPGTTILGAHAFVLVNPFSATSGTHKFINSSANFTPSGAGSANYRNIDISYTLTGTAGAQSGNATGIFLNATEATLNGLTHNLIDLQVGSVSQFKVTSGGALTTTGQITTSNSIVVGSSYSLHFNSRTGFSSALDGNLKLQNWAGSDFGLLQFGGITSSFPALKRNGSALDARLADDSNYAGLIVGYLTAQNSDIKVGAGNGHTFNGRSGIYSPADGVLKLSNNAGTDFGRLQLGGTTSSFPAIKRSGTGILIRLADDTAYTNITFADGNVNGSFQMSQISTPSNPSTNYNRLYFKSDDLPYTLTSAGTEKALVDISTSQTLTNKTIAGGSNTISGITESMLSFSDVTTLNVSTSQHGLVPKAPNDTSKFLRGDGTWAAAGGGTFSGARIYDGTGLTISTGSETTLTFNSESFDTDSYHDTGSNTGRLTVPSTAKYLVIFNFSFICPSSTPFQLKLQLKKNNTTTLLNQWYESFSYTSGKDYRLHFSTVVDLTAADYLTTTLYQSSGSNMSINAGADHMTFEIIKLG